ncbi:zinc-finger homeodomain protein 2-like [Diospyros lotus]|uniref:zinc-finger homeodomain protein 2-like n=1 Tax=Diospyros lotus TaxID=55363 RepID=UPI002255EA18|nr:zinc-finger homeodomain protein 2-like [Diospyros lotus]
MEMKGQEGFLDYNPAFRESLEGEVRNRTSNPDRLTGGGGERIEPKPSGSSLKVAIPAASGGARYKECMKNHAASVGGKVLDGCGEFMPGGDDGTAEALKCAACSCHRSFHRKDSASGAALLHPLHLPPPLPSPQLKISPHMNANYFTSMVPPVKVAFCGGGSDSSSEDLNFNAPPPPPPPFVLSKKRFRTKFTQEQKDRMLEFAEKVGWRIPREEDAEVQRFCAEVGVKRQVFKVWMHNNKTSSSKKQQSQPQE